MPPLSVADLIQVIEQGRRQINILGLEGSASCYALSRILNRERTRTILIVTATEKLALQMNEAMALFTAGSITRAGLVFPAPDTLPYTKLPPHPDTWIERLKTLHQLQKKEPMVICASIESLLRRLPPKEMINLNTFIIHKGETIDRDELLRHLVEMGYSGAPLVEEEGTFASRGGILDLWTPTTERPLRIELEDDFIISIRAFDSETQRTSYTIDTITVIPVRSVIIQPETLDRMTAELKRRADDLDIPPLERREFVEVVDHGIYPDITETLMPLFYEATSSFIDHLPEDTLIHFDNMPLIEEEAAHFLRQLSEAHAQSSRLDRVIKPHELYNDLNEFIKISSHCTNLFSGSFTASDPCIVETHPTAKLRDTIPMQPGVDPLTPISNQIQSWQKEGYKIIMTCHTPTQGERLVDLFRWQGLGIELSELTISQLLDLSNAKMYVVMGRLPQGFRWPQEKLLIITDEEIFGTKISKRPPRTTPAEVFTNFEELEVGDHLVHNLHGIGRYTSLINMEINGIKNDFLVLEYLGGDKLYVPVYRLNLIQKYIGPGEGFPILDRLGGTRWIKAQKKAKLMVRQMAVELLKIYAAREVHKGFAFSQRDKAMEEFEAAFPYDETPDQWQSIEDVLKDMQDDKPMDRLICGDVGYGKTEVAMRAAFRAAMDGKQVAVLVPTTVLALQHHETFIERFKGTPVRIDMLTRFRSRSEANDVITAVEKGRVDIMIGTHRLLQRDLKFRDLGLLIIDEEHRFGVAHKERIKKLKAVVDVVTMSATPIPRTLNMALSGMRNISIINTPPLDRLAIRTHISPFDELLIRDAITKELSRGGQVFFVHNRVETIQSMKDRLKLIVPDAKIAVGHGQMHAHELEEVMIGFLEGKYDVLLCTTIIESGLDIPRANTIIINRADTFGLAQLYQLRGRVGRSNRQAYAYLLTPEEETVSLDAKRRLAALQKHTDLGSGFQIAMHDLEIRGAGNLLGAQQSGQIAAIGFELYSRLLERAIRHLKGEEEEIEIDTEISLPVEAYFDTDYVPNSGMRIVLYKRLSSLETVDQIDDFTRELMDRFGPLPEAALNLMKMIEVKLLAKKLAIESIKYDGVHFVIKLNTSTTVDIAKLMNLAQERPGEFILRPDSNIIVKSPQTGASNILSSLKKIMSEIGKI